MGEREDVVAEAAAVGVVDGAGEVRLVMSKPSMTCAASPEGGMATVWNGAWRAVTCV